MQQLVVIVGFTFFLEKYFLFRTF